MGIHASKSLYQAYIFRSAEEANPVPVHFRRNPLYLFRRSQDKARQEARSFVQRLERYKGILRDEINVVPIPLRSKIDRPAGCYLCSDGSVAILHARS